MSDRRPDQDAPTLDQLSEPPETSGCPTSVGGRRRRVVPPAVAGPRLMGDKGLLLVPSSGLETHTNTGLLNERRI